MTAPVGAKYPRSGFGSAPRPASENLHHLEKKWIQKCLDSQLVCAGVFEKVVRHCWYLPGCFAVAECMATRMREGGPEVALNILPLQPGGTPARTHIQVA